MKILAMYHPQTLMWGFKGAAEKDGDKWVWWDINHTPAFQVFKDVIPDIFVLHESQLHIKDIVKCIYQYHPTVIVQKDNVFNFETNGKSLNYTLVYDTLTNYKFDPLEFMRCDICYVGEPDPVIEKVCYPLGKLNVKIFGPTMWGIPQYMGNISQSGKIKLFNSADAIYTNNLLDLAIAFSIGKRVYTKILPDNYYINQENFLYPERNKTKSDNFLSEKILNKEILYMKPEGPSYEEVWKNLKHISG